MNKATLTEDLDYAGFTVTSFKFSAAGYELEVKLNPARGKGWDAFERLPIPGLELAKHRETGVYTRQVLLIPCNSKEFKDYVNKHVKYYGLGKEKALSDLSETIGKYGTKYTKMELESYLKRVANK